MKTVPTVVASTSAVAASVLGLAFARQELGTTERRQQDERERLQQRSVSAPLLDMTSTTTYTLPPIETLSASPHSFTFSSPSPYTPPTARPNVSSGASRDRTPQFGAGLEAGDGQRSLKRNISAREATQRSSDSPRSVHEAEDASSSARVTQATQASWLRRLSTFSSNDGSLPSSPRPPSTAVSQSNGSFAFSNAGSTAPMFPSFTPVAAPPNKLVKRSSSIRSNKANSRIPLPTFKRPATSHERDATLHELHGRPSTGTSSMAYEYPHSEATGSTWRSYFSPKVTLDNALTSTSRRSSTSIPNPIKRIHPDRRYHPVLISTSESIRPASIDFDRENNGEQLSSFKNRRQSINLRVSRRFFSSPLPQRPSTASSNTSASLSKRSRPTDSQVTTGSESTSNRNSQFSFSQIDQPTSSPQMNRRSFSPTDLAPPELPKWKRPTKPKPAEAKYRRKGIRNTSGPDSSMGSQPHAASIETERPAKRRDVSGSSRQGSIHSRDDSIRSPKASIHEAQSIRNGSPGQTKTLQAFASEGISEHRSPQARASPYTEVNAFSSPAAGSMRSRPSRQSAALSEFASTFAGSDSDARYNDDDDMESPSDTLFDSVRTRATSASSAGVKGPRIDAIFDESRRPTGESSPPSMDHLFQITKFGKEPFERPRHSIIEEEESVSTPVRSTHNGSMKTSPETFRFGSSPPRPLTSSPPEVPIIFRRKASEDAGLGIEDDEAMWDFGEEDKLPRWPLEEHQTQGGRGIINGKAHPQLLATPYKSFSDQAPDAKTTIFDWSEQQSLEKSPAGRSPPRPRTVHGKKDAENRGSRSVGRRAPSGIHVRSQSVPVAPELDGKRSQVVTNKFGTWGVGSKGVTEDWNDDFDFEEPVPAIPAAYQQGDQQEVVQHTQSDAPQGSKDRQVSGSMRVPQNIQRQQENVLANIGLLREWGLLIEELKDLRMKAVSLHLRDEGDGEMWREVDAMIDLADQESNDHTLAPRQSPPSSPTFDMSAFDDPVPQIPMRNSPRPAPKLHAEDIFDSPAHSPARKPADQPSPRRPRKDSEAVARSVIEALQQRRNISDPTSNSTGYPSKKVPFDTATLRRIVPYVQEMRDTVKRTIREAEDLYQSPQPDLPEEPTFSRMFQPEPPESPSLQHARRRSSARAERGMSDDTPSRSPPDELTRRMELMTMG